mmetsp:Transcript_25818/g.36054  ORF Transcript_25818/g.36054 Transcript_25818/m.36054 type:complete len:194 (-) Transcript_25818:397-978(-)
MIISVIITDSIIVNFARNMAFLLCTLTLFAIFSCRMRLLDARIRKLQTESAESKRGEDCRSSGEGNTLELAAAAGIKSGTKCSSRRSSEPRFYSGRKSSMEKKRNDALEDSRRRITKLICLSLLYVLVAFTLLVFSTIEAIIERGIPNDLYSEQVRDGSNRYRPLEDSASYLIIFLSFNCQIYAHTSINVKLC